MKHVCIYYFFVFLKHAALESMLAGMEEDAGKRQNPPILRISGVHVPVIGTGRRAKKVTNYIMFLCSVANSH
jgi:hypothetical protein